MTGWVWTGHSLYMTRIFHSWYGGRGRSEEREEEGKEGDRERSEGEEGREEGGREGEGGAREGRGGEGIEGGRGRGSVTVECWSCYSLCQCASVLV